MTTFRKHHRPGYNSLTQTQSQPKLPGHHRQRRVTLARLLLTPIDPNQQQRQQCSRKGTTLMDLLSSSASILDVKEENDGDDDNEVHIVSSTIVKESKSYSSSGGNKKGSKRVVSKVVGGSPGVRFRFLKRPWRPMLIAIPEGKLMEHY